MTVEILRSKSQCRAAREEMRRRGIDFTVPRRLRWLHKVGIYREIVVGDFLKSWDVWKTIQFLEENIDKEVPVLDVGAYASELLCALNRLRYLDLTGIDLNPEIHRMPFPGAIRYVDGDFMRSPFPDGAFGAITAISVLEHGFDGRRIFGEISRLLRPGGYLIASVDYWPEKVDTGGITPFGIDWRIFSKEEIVRFLGEAEVFGLAAHGKMDFDAEEKVVKWNGKRYTFAWMVLRKDG